MAEKSLLQKIREKELEMSVMIDQERNRADQLLEQAGREASSLLAASDREGRQEADEFLRNKMDAIQMEADHLRVSLADEVDSFRRKGEENLQRTVEKIVSLLTSE